MLGIERAVKGGIFGKDYLKWFFKWGGIILILRLILLWWLKDHTINIPIIRILGRTFIEMLILFFLLFGLVRLLNFLEKKK